MNMEPIQCSETSGYKIQTPGNYPEDNILRPQHGESLKTTKRSFFIEILLSHTRAETATKVTLQIAALIIEIGTRCLKAIKANTQISVS
jgi:hypothetical protein